MRQILPVLLKGFGVGASMLVPGVSGGSMAIILGIYDQLIHAVAGFKRSVKRNTLFLLIFSLGAIAGMLAAARPLLLLFTLWPVPARYFFSGAVMGSIPMLLAKARLRRLRWRQLLWPLLGCGTVLFLSTLSRLYPSPAAPELGAAAPSVWFLFITGLMTAVALVLPGVSVSYVWLLMGLYDSIMRAVGSLNISYLLPLALGMVPGIVLSARVLDQVMRRWPAAAYLSIAGFLLGSLAGIFPGLPVGWGWFICPFLWVTGLGAVLALSRA